MSLNSVEQRIKTEVEAAESRLKTWFAKTFEALKAAVPAISHTGVNNVLVNNPVPDPHVPAPVPVEETPEHWEGLHEVMRNDFSRVATERDDAVAQIAAAKKDAPDATEKAQPASETAATGAQSEPVASETTSAASAQ